MNKYILVTAEKFGFGPIMTCLHIIKKLRPLAKEKNINLIFLGTSIALDQAQKSALFDKVIKCETYDYDCLKEYNELFKNAEAVLCSENQFGAIWAKKLGVKNVYFVDNLVWMWDKITPGLEDVDGYFISEIFDSKTNFSRIGTNIKNPIFVGPLRSVNIKNYKTKNQLLINFGGAESFMFEGEIVVDFYKKITSEILTEEVKNKFDKIYITGGSGVINALQGFAEKTVLIKSHKYEDYLRIMHESSHLIMSSGLGNFIETIGVSKNIMYIPPINYSQLLQLDEYKKLNLGLEIINWSDYSFFEEIPQLLDEETGVNLVIENVQKYLTSNENIINKKTKLFINSTQDKYFSARKNYVTQFPRNAASVITKYIINSIEE